MQHNTINYTMTNATYLSSGNLVKFASTMDLGPDALSNINELFKEYSVGIS